MIRHNLITAWRNIRKYFSQNVISVVGLAASLLSFSLCMHFSRYIMGTDKHFPNYDRIAEVVVQEKGGGLSIVSQQESEKIKTFPLNTLKSLCTLSGGMPLIGTYEDETGKRIPFSLKSIETDTTFATVFSVDVVAGNWEQASHTPNALVLSASIARRLFGSEQEAVGRTLFCIRRQDTPYTVQAVMADLPLNISFFEMGIDVLIMNDLHSLRKSEYSYNYTGYTFGLLPDGVDREDVTRELQSVVLPNITHIRGRERTDETLVATHMGAYMDDSKQMIAGIITTFATLILAVGLLNFLHFLVGSILNRTHEYSLRRLMGCRTRNLFWMLLTQIVIMLLAAGGLCRMAVSLLAPHITVPPQVGRFMLVEPERLMTETMEYIGWLFLLCVLICLGVCLHIRRITIHQGVSGGSDAPRLRRHLGRNLMMGLQFFICWVFVSLTVAFYLQARLSTGTVLNSLSRTEKEEILSIPLGSTAMHPDEKLVLIERLKAHPGIKDVLLVDNELIDGSSGMGILTEKGNPESKIDVLIDEQPRHYYDFMHVEVVRGVLPEADNHMVADTDFAALFDEDILGRSFYFQGDDTPYTVTAIVQSIPRTIQDYGMVGRNKCGYVYPLENRARQAQPYIGHIYLKCHTGQMEAVRQHALDELHKAFPPTVTPQVQTLMKDIKVNQGMEVILQDIILFFAIVSLIITLLGVYSAITLDTERRRREVAIRKVHGAAFRDILWMFGSRYFWLLVIPALPAFPIVGWILTLMREDYTVFISIGPLFWLGIFLGVALLVVLTILWRILKVARSRPAEEIGRG